MSDKMECPGCGAYSSSVLIRVTEGDPCPFCGLSAHAIFEIQAVRRSKADEKIKQTAEDAIKKLGQQQTEIDAARRFMRDIRDALHEYEKTDPDRVSD